MIRCSSVFLVSLLTFVSSALAQPMAAPLGPSRVVASPDACADGLVPDDGSAETGYGWVPSTVDGLYVQEIVAEDFPIRELQTVCVCWLRTRPDDDIDFEVVFYSQVDGRPAPAPYASFPARAAAVPLGVTGRFYEIDVDGIRLDPGPSYMGVRWNPSLDQFFFICTDTSPATDPVEAFFIDDRASDWTSVLESQDSIFAAHRAILLRAQSRAPTLLDVPTLSRSALALFIFLLAVTAIALRRSLAARRQ